MSYELNKLCWWLVNINIYNVIVNSYQKSLICKKQKSVFDSPIGLLRRERVNFVLFKKKKKISVSTLFPS